MITIKANELIKGDQVYWADEHGKGILVVEDTFDIPAGEHPPGMSPADYDRIAATTRDVDGNRINIMPCYGLDEEIKLAGRIGTSGGRAIQTGPLIYIADPELSHPWEYGYPDLDTEDLEAVRLAKRAACRKALMEDPKTAHKPLSEGLVSGTALYASVETVLFDGHTAAGLTVRVTAFDGGGYARVADAMPGPGWAGRIWLGGNTIKVMRYSVFRDGGTRVWDLDEGHRLRQPRPEREIGGSKIVSWPDPLLDSETIFVDLDGRR